MNAVDVIKENIDVEKILNYYNINYNYHGDYIRCKCPIHNGDNPTAFVVNDKFLWSCHTGDCGNGDVFTFIEKMEDVDFINATKKLAEILDLNINGMIIAERKNTQKKDLENFLKYISSKKKQEVNVYTPKAELVKVKTFRNYNKSTLEHFEVMYTKEICIDRKDGTSFKLYERIYIPIYEDGKLIGASLRKRRAKDNPKWFHVPQTIKIGSVLYNKDNINTSDEYVIVVEGIFDVFSWYEAGFNNVVCTFGAHLTEEQYRMLLRMGKDVIWCFDGDNAGIIATKQAVEKMRYKVTQWVIQLPEGADPGNCTSEDLKRYFDEKEKII